MACSLTQYARVRSTYKALSFPFSGRIPGSSRDDASRGDRVRNEGPGIEKVKQKSPGKEGKEKSGIEIRPTYGQALVAE